MGSIWTRLLEACTEALGATDGPADAVPGGTQRRLRLRIRVAAGLFAAGAVLYALWGATGLLPCAALLLLAVGAARAVERARAALWRAAALALDDPAQRPGPGPDALVAVPAAKMLTTLAAVIDAVRRERYAVALERLPYVERAALRPDEARLLDAARALISLGLGDPVRAAQQAIVALPTGIDEIDARLGRVVLADAWNNPARLRVIHRAWQKERRGGATSEALERLMSLSQLRFKPGAVEALTRDEARALAADAWAIGEEELAAMLEARARGGVYR